MFRQWRLLRQARLWVVAAVLVGALGLAWLGGAAEVAPAVAAGGEGGTGMVVDQAGGQPEGGAVDKRATISVSGFGQVAAYPDTAQLNLGVNTVGRTAQEAQRQNAELLSRAVDVLLARGLSRQDIQTSNYSIWPEYNYREQKEDGQPPEITGYRVTNQLTVKLKNTDQIGATIDALIGAGINQVNGISFAVADDGALRLRALEAAVKDAQAKAEAIARALGREIGGLVSVNEGGYNSPGPVYYSKAMEGAGGGVAQAPTPIEPGQYQVSASISAMYFLK